MVQAPAMAMAAAAAQSLARKYFTIVNIGIAS